MRRGNSSSTSSSMSIRTSTPTITVRAFTPSWMSGSPVGRSCASDSTSANGPPRAAFNRRRLRRTQNFAPDSKCRRPGRSGVGRLILRLRLRCPATFCNRSRSCVFTVSSAPHLEVGYPPRRSRAVEGRRYAGCASPLQLDCSFLRSTLFKSILAFMLRRVNPYAHDGELEVKFFDFQIIAE